MEIDRRTAHYFESTVEIRLFHKIRRAKPKVHFCFVKTVILHSTNSHALWPDTFLYDPSKEKNTQIEHKWMSKLHRLISAQLLNHNSEKTFEHSAVTKFLCQILLLSENKQQI